MEKTITKRPLESLNPDFLDFNSSSKSPLSISLITKLKRYHCPNQYLNCFAPNPKLLERLNIRNLSFSWDFGRLCETRSLFGEFGNEPFQNLKLVIAGGAADLNEKLVRSRALEGDI